MADSTRPAISSRRLCISSSSSLKWIKGSSSVDIIFPSYNTTRGHRAVPENGARENRSLENGSAEPPRNVIFRFSFSRALEDDLGLVEFNQVAQQKEAGELRHARGLLHVVRHNHLRALVFEGEQQILDLGSGNRVQRRTRLVQ